MHHYCITLGPQTMSCGSVEALASSKEYHASTRGKPDGVLLNDTPLLTLQIVKNSSPGQLEGIRMLQSSQMLAAHANQLSTSSGRGLKQQHGIHCSVQAQHNQMHVVVDNYGCSSLERCGTDLFYIWIFGRVRECMPSLLVGKTHMHED
eukprot:5724651-Amphidinium_carterae.2